MCGGYNENVCCFISAGSGCVNKHLFTNTSVCIFYPHKGNRTPILYWHANTEWMMSSFLNQLFNKIRCWGHILYMVGWNENSRFQTLHQRCEIAPPRCCTATNLTIYVNGSRFLRGLHESISHSWLLNENQFLISHPHTKSTLYLVLRAILQARHVFHSPVYALHVCHCCPVPVCTTHLL